MFRKIFEHFSKKNGKTNALFANIPEEFEIKYLDEHGEMHMVDIRDYEAFHKVVTNRRNKVVF